MAKYQNSAELIESCFSDIQNDGEIHAAQKGLKKVFFVFFSRRLRFLHVLHIVFPDLNIQIMILSTLVKGTDPDRSIFNRIFFPFAIFFCFVIFLLMMWLRPHIRMDTKARKKKKKQRTPGDVA